MTSYEFVNFKNTRHIILRMCCPKAKQFGFNNTCDDKLLEWKDISCEHTVFISEDGICSCCKHYCLTPDYFIGLCKFNCNSYSHDTEYVRIL